MSRQATQNRTENLPCGPLRQRLRIDRRVETSVSARVRIMCVCVAIGWFGCIWTSDRITRASTAEATQDAVETNASDGWAASILDDAFERIDGKIEQFDAAGVTVRASDGTSRRVEMSRVASIEAFDLSSSRSHAGVIDGDRATESELKEELDSLWWMSMNSGVRMLGEPVTMDSVGGEQLLWRRGDVVIRVPLGSVRGFWRASMSPTLNPSNDRSSGLSSEQSRRQDVDHVHLGNGEVLTGIVDRMDEAGVAVEGESGGRADWKDVVSVQLAEVATDDGATTNGTPEIGTPGNDASGQTQGADGSTWIVETRLGERVRLRSPSMQKGEISGQAFGATFSYRADELASLRPMSGSVRWLVDATPIEAKSESYFGDAGHLQVKYVSAARRTISVRARTVLSYEVGDAKRLRLSVSVPRMARRADVTARIWGDDTMLHENLGLRAGEVGGVIDIDVTGRRIVRLEVDFGSRFGVDDELHWVDAALLR